jgi:hypothetical protein
VLLKIGKTAPQCPKLLPSVEYTGESRLPCDEYTEESTSWCIWNKHQNMMTKELYGNK